MSLEADAAANDRPRYARFSRRARGIVIDWILAVSLIFGALLVTASARSDVLARVLGILVVTVLLLYEPVLVSLTGSTLGHYFANLRVVDERHRGNVSFGKALARMILKSLLGWYSFIVITATRRNQAVHDLLTRSTVQIRDPAKALPHHYITERTDFQAADMPSRLRRLAVICAYLLLVCLTYGTVLIAGSAAGAFSPDCIAHERCRVLDNLFIFSWGLLWLATCAACIGLGRRGKLFGARRGMTTRR
jgi:uncharacterized RDD family membrane protein YckC